MANITDVIDRLEKLRATHGDLEVCIVNYHSDFYDDLITDLDVAIRATDDPYRVSIPGKRYQTDKHIVIGGESR